MPMQVKQSHIQLVLMLPVQVLQKIPLNMNNIHMVLTEKIINMVLVLMLA